MEDVRVTVYDKHSKVVRNNQAEGGPLVQSIDLDDIYIRSMYFDKIDTENEPHSHTYAHYTFLATGSCLATLDGKETVYHAPCVIFTPAHVLHYFKALEKNTALHCINVLHDGEPILVDSK